MSINVIWIHLGYCYLFVVCMTKNKYVLNRPWWRHQMETFPLYWPFVRGIHRSPVNSPHKGQWRGALMSSLIWTWIKGWVNNREAGDLRRHRVHYDVTVMHFPDLITVMSQERHPDLRYTQFDCFKSNNVKTSTPHHRTFVRGMHVRRSHSPH